MPTTCTPKVLISDQMSPKAAEIFRARGIEVDEITGLSKDELIKIIGNYDGLAIRSSTKVTKEVLAAATNLKVVGRAGIGVDNVDIPAASALGVVVMNTPFGNSITTAEPAIALMFAHAGLDRRRQHRQHCRRSCIGPEDEGDRLRSVPHPGTRRAYGRDQGDAG